MHKKTLLLAITASFLLNACDDTFTVDETKYKGNTGTENNKINKEVSEGCENIQYIEYTQKDTNNKITVNKTTNSSQNTLPDLSWNFKHHICPPIAPNRIYIPEQNDTCYCTDKPIVCKNGEVMYENNAKGFCISKKCSNNQWITDETNQCSGDVSCKQVNGTFTGCGECKNSAQKCEEDTEGNGSIYTCVDGKWSDKKFDCMADTTHKASCLDDTECAKCLENAYKYDNSIDELCIHQKCQNGSWVNTTDNQCPSNVSCKKENGTYIGCGECQNEAQKCEEDAEGNGSIYTCVDGKWSDNKIDCMADTTHRTSCKNDTQCSQCLENAYKYDNNEGLCTPQICINHEWIDEPVQEELGYPLHQCMKETEGNIVPIGVSCKQEDDQYNCGECFNGDTRCVNGDGGTGHIETCRDGNWDTSAPKACMNGKDALSCLASGDECGICLDNDKKLDNVTNEDGNDICKIKKCESGKWTETKETSCNADVSCKITNDGNNACGECINGTKKCDNVNGNGQQLICENGTWIVSFNCMDGTKYLACMNDTQCGECTNGDSYFKNDENEICTKMICKSGQFQKSDDFVCTYSCQVDETNTPIECGECQTGTQKCDIVDGTAREFVCVQGKWEPIQNCTYHSCMTGDNDTTKCSECEDGSSKFMEDPDTHICSRMTCQDGKYVSNPDPEYESEAKQVSCNADLSDYGNCLNGVSKCENDINTKGINTICINGVSKTIECLNGCEGDHCKTQACDNPGTQKCESGILINCNAQGEESYQACSLGQCLTDNSDCAECLSDRCVNDADTHIGTVSKCTNYKSGASLQCETSCNEELTGCGSCIDDDIQCTTLPDTKLDVIQKCENGAWKTQTHCTQASCAEDNTCGECINDAVHCITTAENINIEQTCKNGRWTEDSPCTDNNSCNQETNKCGECINGHQKCESLDSVQVIYECQNGHWNAVESCTNSCTNLGDNQYKCGVCKDTTEETNTIRYIDQSDKSCMIQTCANGLWVNKETCKNNYSCKKSDDGSVTGCGECVDYTSVKDGWHVKSCYHGKYSKVYCALSPKELGDYYECTWGLHEFGCYNRTENGITTGRVYGENRNCNKNYSCNIYKIDGFFVGTCGECVENTHQCKDNKTRQTCVNGTWGFDETCDGSCSNGECRSSDIL